MYYPLSFYNFKVDDYFNFNCSFYRLTKPLKIEFIGTSLDQSSPLINMKRIIHLIYNWQKMESIHEAHNSYVGKSWQIFSYSFVTEKESNWYKMTRRKNYIVHMYSLVTIII